ncbi:MAG: YcaQ family DNA glycosylase [Labilithrix sp.]|nr:YcaQ family DNA glycosylase [Labilithrix sp.]
MVELTVEEARRIAVRAQGFGAAGATGTTRASGVGPTPTPRSKPTTSARSVELVERLGVVQLDSVNVVCRAHYLPLFARLGAYDRDRFDASIWSRPSALFEYWGHQASLLPVAHHRLFRWRMDRAARGEGTWSGVARFGREKHAFVADVLREIAEKGPAAASALSMATTRKGGWWEWSDAKRAVEWLFWSGRVTAASRRNFERLYDLPERVLPPEALAAKTASPEDAHRELLAIAARAYGVATEDDLCDYFRLARRESRPRIAELVEEGVLVPARVEGWDRPAYLERGITTARPPRARRVAALLTPFDPLVWFRPRTERLFGFRYRIEIYTPAHERTHGYYVMPFLLDERLVGRVDLKADRARRVLSVRAAHVEDGVAPEAVAEPLAGELGRLAVWLGLEDVEIVRKGRLAAALRAAVARAADTSTS